MAGEIGAAVGVGGERGRVDGGCGCEGGGGEGGHGAGCAARDLRPVDVSVGVGGLGERTRGGRVLEGFEGCFGASLVLELAASCYGFAG